MDPVGGEPAEGWVKKKAGNKKEHSGKLTVFTPKNDGFPIGISELPGGFFQEV